MSQSTDPDSHETGKLYEKLKRFCAYQERCTLDVDKKIKALGGTPIQAQHIIALLNKEGFLNEQRFAQMFAHGKFSNNRWGRNKIKAELITRNIPSHILNEALTAIDQQQYLDTLQELIRLKAENLQAKQTEHINEKTANYCIQKGYEPSLTWEIINRINPM